MMEVAGGADNSPPLSDNAGSWSWTQWGIDLGDISGLNTGSNLELCGLVEDKEIAARAVAFVVNSTRKGIVPLCADVANLLRSKQSLESKLYQLKRDHALIISSASASSIPSQSMSPTPPSICSYTDPCNKHQPENTAIGQDLRRSSSRCSNCSSTLSGYSPKFDKSRGGAHRQQGTHSSFTSSGDSHGREAPVNQSTRTDLRDGTSSKHSSHPVGDRLNVSARTDTTVVTVHSEHIRERLPNENPSKEIKAEDSPGVVSQTADTARRSSHNYTAHNVPHNTTQLESGPSVGLDKRSKTPKEISVFTFHIENEKINGGINYVDSYNDTSSKKAPAPETGDSAISRRGYKERSKVKARNERLKRAGDRRRQSLPEMTSTPNIEAFRVRPKISKETQCNLQQYPGNTSPEDAFVKSASVNAKLLEDLGAARKEIAELKKRLKDMEHQDHTSSRHCDTDNSYIDGGGDAARVDDRGYYTSGSRASQGEGHSRKGGASKCGVSLTRTTPVTYGGTVANCQCSNCQEAMGSGDDLSHYSDKMLEEPPQKFAVSNKLHVQLDDHVLIKGDNSGYIRYIGHLDKSGHRGTLYAGLEMDHPMGSHDGYFGGKRYFFCPKFNGLFVPLVNVLGHYNKVSTSDIDNGTTVKKPHRTSTAL